MPVKLTMLALKIHSFVGFNDLNIKIIKTVTINEI